MPCWYFDKKELRNTPSLLDGIDFETELRYRREGARFIMDIGSKMDLGYNTMATGVVYFHRFYMFHSFRNFHRFVTACGCLFLAGKVEETPKKCKDIIKAAKGLVSDQKFATFGEDPKEEVMTLERILLQTIKFDLQVEHPYHFIVKYAKCLKGDKTKLQKMVQMAWTFVNDSLCTTLCLQWEPEVIAVALMYLAGKLSKFEVVDWSGRTGKHLRWWDMFIDDVTMDLLEDICHQVLDLYSQPANPNPPDSPPLVKSRDVSGITILPDPSITPTLHTMPGVKGVVGGKVDLKGVVVDVSLAPKMVVDPLKGAQPPLPPIDSVPPPLFPGGPFPPPPSAAVPPPLFAPPPPAQYFSTPPSALPPSRPFFPNP